MKSKRGKFTDEELDKLISEIEEDCDAIKLCDALKELRAYRQLKAEKRLLLLPCPEGADVFRVVNHGNKGGWIVVPTIFDIKNYHLFDHKLLFTTKRKAENEKKRREEEKKRKEYERTKKTI